MLGIHRVLPAGRSARGVREVRQKAQGVRNHNHHAFPTSAAHGLRRFEVDPSALVIRGPEKLGLAWNVVRVSAERQAAKAAVAA
jgi:fatty-acid desaturase